MFFITLLRHPVQLGRRRSMPIMSSTVWKYFSRSWTQRPLCVSRTMSNNLLKNIVGVFEIWTKGVQPSLLIIFSMRWSCKARAPLRFPSQTCRHWHRMSCRSEPQDGVASRPTLPQTHWDLDVSQALARTIATSLCERCRRTCQSRFSLLWRVPPVRVSSNCLTKMCAVGSVGHVRRFGSAVKLSLPQSTRRGRMEMPRH